MMYLLVPVLMAAAAKPSVCERLHESFVQNEKVFAIIYGSRRLDLQIERRSGTEREIESARRALEKTEEEFKSQGDRITTLLIANGCKPPDHVTSPFTYAEKSEPILEPQP